MNVSMSARDHVGRRFSKETSRDIPTILLATSAIALVSSVVFAVAIIVDDSQILGVSAWAKPLKFSLSICIFTLSLGVIIAYLPQHKRALMVWANIAALALIGEFALIIFASVQGRTSHFNVGTPLAAGLWAMMGITIILIWCATAAVTLYSFLTKITCPSRALALRGGLIVAIVGMGIGFLMIAPTADQLQNYQGVIGAHTVGAPDGGAGILLLGWSLTHGDYRISHFIGMHAMQVFPLVVMLLEIFAGRVPLLRNSRNRLLITTALVISYSGFTLLTLWQAFRGQPIVQPDGWTILATSAVMLGTGVVTAGSLAARKVKRTEWSNSNDD